MGFFSRKTLPFFHGIFPGGTLSISSRRAGILLALAGGKWLR
jgi:hypothetical protein